MENILENPDFEKSEMYFGKQQAKKNVDSGSTLKTFVNSRPMVKNFANIQSF